MINSSRGTRHGDSDLRPPGRRRQAWRGWTTRPSEMSTRSPFESGDRNIGDTVKPHRGETPFDSGVGHFACFT